MGLAEYSALVRLATGTLVGLLAFFGLASPGSAQGSGPKCKVTAVKAMLFYDRTGTFSGDVLADAPEAPLVPSLLWNTPIKNDPSSSVLVVVETTGKIAYGKHYPLLEFTAQYRSVEGGARHVVIRKRVRIHSLVGEAAKRYEGFWLYDTGCYPVKISARVIARGQAPVVRTMNFGCGE